MIKDFIIEKIFEKIDTKKIKGKANDFPTEPDDDYIVPLLTAGIENQGLSRYAKQEDCSTILSNCISISANGANSGVTFYHPENFAVLQDAYAVKLRGYEITSEEIYLYLTSSLYKAIAYNHSWTNKAGWNKIKKDSIALPIKRDKCDYPIIDNTRFYHKDGYIPDFEYMEQYIRELEQERIRELEQYLAVTGLDDYELTEEDKRVLSLSTKSALTQGQNNKNVGGYGKKVKEFKIGDLFEIATGRDFIIGNTLKGDIPLVSHTNEHNGITAYVQKQNNKRLFNSKNTIALADRGVFYATTQPKDFYIGTRVKALTLKYGELSEKQRLFLTTAINKLQIMFTDYLTNATNKLPQLKISLPVNDNDEPDFEYMEQYIRAMEKVVIKGVVEYKDKIIATTKQVAAGI